MVHSIYSLVCFPYMCAEACFRDLLWSLCLQDSGLGWKKKLTVDNVWFKLMHWRPHGWSLFKVNLHFPSFTSKAVRNQTSCPPALLPLVTTRREGFLDIEEDCEGLGMLNLHPSPSSKWPAAWSVSSRSLPQVGLTLKHPSKAYNLLGLTLGFVLSVKMLHSPWNPYK